MPALISHWRNRIFALEDPISVRYAFTVYASPFWPERSNREAVWLWTEH